MLVCEFNTIIKIYKSVASVYLNCKQFCLYWSERTDDIYINISGKIWVFVMSWDTLRIGTTVYTSYKPVICFEDDLTSIFDILRMAPTSICTILSWSQSLFLYVYNGYLVSFIGSYFGTLERVWKI